MKDKESIRERLKTSPRLKRWIDRIIMNQRDARPRWYIRLLAPLYQHRGAGSKIYHSVRMDTPPYRRFWLGRRSVVQPCRHPLHPDRSCLHRQPRAPGAGHHRDRPEPQLRRHDEKDRPTRCVHQTRRHRRRRVDRCQRRHPARRHHRPAQRRGSRSSSHQRRPPRLRRRWRPRKSHQAARAPILQTLTPKIHSKHENRY